MHANGNMVMKWVLQTEGVLRNPVVTLSRHRVFSNKICPKLNCGSCWFVQLNAKNTHLIDRAEVLYAMATLVWPIVLMSPMKVIDRSLTSGFR